MVGAFLFGAKSGIEYKEELERLKISFTSLTGSAAESARLVGEVRKLARAGGLNFEDVAIAERRFLALGLSAEKSIPLLKAVLNTVAAIGGTSETVDRVSLALAQMSAKQRVMTQELNQLSEVGIDGWRILQQETGKTRLELVRMVEAGEVSANTFIDAFKRMSAEKFGDATGRQAGTLTGALNTLKGAGKDALREGFAPLHASLTHVAGALADIVRNGLSAERILKSVAASGAEFGFSVGGVPSSAILAQAWGERASRGRGGVAGGPDAKAQAQRFLDEFKVKRETLEKEFKALAPAFNILSGLDSEIRTFGNNSKVAAVTEGFRAFRRELAATGGTFSAEAIAGLDKWERESITAARALDNLIQKQKEQEKAEREAAKAADIQTQAIDTARRAFADAFLTQTNFGLSQAEALGNTLRFAVGITHLSDEQDKLTESTARSADTFIRKTQLLTLGSTLEDALAESTKRNREALRGELTETEKVNDALSEYLKILEKLTGQMPFLTKRQHELAESARSAAAEVDRVNTLMGFADRMHALSALIRDVPLTITQPNSQLPSPTFNPLDLSKVKSNGVEEWRQVAEDLSEIFSNVFEGIEDGWRGMWAEMLNVARTTLLEISRDLMKMALTGEKSGAGGIIGMAANWLGSALFGGLLGGVGGAHAGGHKIGLGTSWGGAAYAAGTMSAPPGFALVGERGPELVAFRGGEQVFNNADSRKMLGGQTIINKTTVINYQPRVTPDSYSSRRSAREGIEGLIAAFAR